MINTSVWSWGCLGILLVTAGVVPAANAANDLQSGYVQALIGAAKFNEDQLTFVESSSGAPDSSATSDLSSMPMLGIGGQQAFSRDAAHFGLDGTILFGWRAHTSSVRAGNGQARVELDTDLIVLDLAMGVYAQALLGDNWRLYGAAGPLLLFAEYSEDVDEDAAQGQPPAEDPDDDSESKFGIGGYARIGLEYRLPNHAFMGFCLRGVATDLEFDNTLDDGGLTGMQGFLTYSQAFR